MHVTVYTHYMHLPVPYLQLAIDAYARPASDVAALLSVIAISYPPGPWPWALASYNTTTRTKETVQRPYATTAAR